MKFFALILIALLFPVAQADDTTTISRSKLLHPNLGHTGGAAVHTHVNDIYKKLGDDDNSRFFTEAALADSASVNFDHNFFTDFDQLQMILYIHNTGTDELTTVTNATTPALTDFTIAATGGDLKRQVTVTNNSGGPEDIALLVLHNGGGSTASNGQGEKNYITNPGAETDGITGWNLYADAAGSTPVDGAGGAPSITLATTVVTAEILRDTVSFKLSKDAANRQGEGVSFDIAIDRADENKLLKYDLEYQTSANYVDGDISVYIYDVDGAVLITPTGTDGVSIPASLTPALKSVSWASTGSTNYRMILHIATVNGATAYDFFFDTVVVGPGTRVRAPPITDWEPYTPPGIPTNVSGTVTSAFQKRDGDSISAEIRITLDGAVTGIITYDAADWLPSGLTFDSAKHAGAGRGSLGQWQGFDASASSTTNMSYGHIAFGSTGGLSLGLHGSPDLATVGSPFTWTSTDVMVFTITRVPIAEWAGSGIIFQPSASDLSIKATKIVTPTGSWTTNVTYTGQYSGSGDTMHFIGEVVLSGAPDVFALRIDIPDSLTVDTSKLSSADVECGAAYILDSSTGTNSVGGIARVKNVSNEIDIVAATNGTFAGGVVTESAPFTFATGDVVSWECEITILEWADLGSIPPIGIKLADEFGAGLVSIVAQTIKGDKTIKGKVTTKQVGAPAQAFEQEDVTGGIGRDSFNKFSTSGATTFVNVVAIGGFEGSGNLEIGTCDSTTADTTQYFATAYFSCDGDTCTCAFTEHVGAANAGMTCVGNVTIQVQPGVSTMDTWCARISLLGSGSGTTFSWSL